MKVEEEATKGSAPASRAWQPPSPKTTTTWCLELLELITGKVRVERRPPVFCSIKFNARVRNISSATFSAGMVRVEQRNKTLVDMEVYDDGPYEVGDENLSDPDLVPVPANSYLGECKTTTCLSHMNILSTRLTICSMVQWRKEDISLVLSIRRHMIYELFVKIVHIGIKSSFAVSGFSLDSGHRLTSSRDLTVVSGAPRANHSGAVLLLKKGADTSSKLLIEHTLHGPGLASAFGYDVAVVDLNADGYQDFESLREKWERLSLIIGVLVGHSHAFPPFL